MTTKESPKNRSLSKRGLILIVAILVIALWAVSRITQPQLVPGQKPLVDIHTIEDLRAQFNRDAGKTRLIVIVAPT